MRWTPIFVALLWAGLAGADGIERAKGRVNDPTTECYSRFAGTAPNFPLANPRIIKCVDNDLTCDSNPAVGRCGITVQVEFNVVDPGNPECTPTDLDDYLVQNFEPDTHPRHDFGFEDLMTVGDAELPLTANDTDELSAAAVIDIKLRVRPRIGDSRWGRKATVLRTRVDAEGLSFDTDRRRLVCVRDETTSPCTGITSTWQQIQEHIIDRSCAVPTCHSAAVAPHLLSLLPVDALTSLIGVQPANASAAAAGKLRVDPGNPGNSFLLDKVLGMLSQVEGDRMPLGNRKLHRLFRTMIEDWIAAGAPDTGFVSTAGCQGP